MINESVTCMMLNFRFIRVGIFVLLLDDVQVDSIENTWVKRALVRSRIFFH